MNKSEKDLYAPLSNGARKAGFLLYRIADASWGQKPFDVGGVAPDGSGVALEAKMVLRLPGPEDPLPESKFRPHQKAWLKAWDARQGLALVVLATAAGEVRVYRFLGDWSTPTKELPAVSLRWEKGGQVISGWEATHAAFFTCPE